MLQIAARAVLRASTRNRIGNNHKLFSSHLQLRSTPIRATNRFVVATRTQVVRRSIAMNATTTSAGDADATNNDKESQSRKRPQQEAEERRDNGWKKVKTKGSNNKRGSAKKGAGKWMKDFGDDSENKRDDPPHVGSFANPAMREMFGIVLDETKDDKETETETETTKDGESQEVVVLPVPTNKRKVILFLGFLGTKYGGFQVNPEQRTLHAEIELALYRAGMINKSNFGTPHKYGWSNSARTDKGVHACAQVCSLKIELPVAEWENKTPDNDRMEGPRNRLQAHLPSDIKVLDMVRATRNFCAKTQRDRVRYQYMVPAFLLHPDWKGVMEEQGIDTSKGRGDRKNVDTRTPLSTEEAEKLYAVLRDYRSTEESRHLLKAALKKYNGTHFFHNFTRGLKPGQAQARRFIETFEAQDPVIVDGIEWIPTQVLGQSFLLHQIRKMICVAIDVARGAAPLEFMDKALDKKESIALHVAPAQGLFLEMSYFGGYNRRKNTQTNHDLPDIDWTKDGPAKERWSAFRDVVRDHICQEDKNQLNFIQFLFLHECVYGCQKSYGLDGQKKEDQVNQEGAPPEKDAETTKDESGLDGQKKEDQVNKEGAPPEKDAETTS